MVIRFNCMVVKNNLGIVRLKEIGTKICVEWITLKHVIKIISALVVIVVKWKHEVRGPIPNMIFCINNGEKSWV